jgi:hypothetical protein
MSIALALGSRCRQSIAFCVGVGSGQARGEGGSGTPSHAWIHAAGEDVDGESERTGSA